MPDTAYLLPADQLVQSVAAAPEPTPERASTRARWWRRLAAAVSAAAAGPSHPALVASVGPNGLLLWTRTDPRRSWSDGDSDR